MTGKGRQSVAVIGAGISGLATAAFLARQGLQVAVFERRPSLGTEGAGIQLTPNACHVLENLDVLEEVKTRAHRALSLDIYSGPSGKHLNKLSFDDGFIRKFGAPYLVIHRQDLIEILGECARKHGAKLIFSSHIETITSQNDPIRFQASDEEYEADFLIGADGVWSHVRTSVNKNSAKPAGRIAFRAVFDFPTSNRPIKDLSIWLGPDAHFVAYPISGGQKINLVAIVKSDDDNQHWSKPVTKNVVFEHYKGWSQDVQNLIDRADNWLSWPLYRVDPDHNWSSDKIVLVGDAAHAMVPFLAQGGAAALEDAAILANAIVTEPSFIRAFGVYETIRKPRVRAICREAFANGARYHLPFPLALARNLYLKSMPAIKLLSRYDWIYDWQPPVINTPPHSRRDRPG